MRRPAKLRHVALAVLPLSVMYLTFGGWSVSTDPTEPHPPASPPAPPSNPQPVGAQPHAGQEDTAKKTPPLKPSDTAGAARNVPHPFPTSYDMEECRVFVGSGLAPARNSPLSSVGPMRKAPSLGECLGFCKGTKGCTVFRFQYWDLACALYEMRDSEARLPPLLAKKVMEDTGKCPTPGVEQDDEGSLPNGGGGGSPGKDVTLAQYSVPQIKEAMGIPHLCRPEVSDHRKWRERVATLPVGYSPRAEFRPALPEALGPSWYCDKIGNPLTPYRALPGRYTEGSLVVGLYSGENLMYSRAAVCLDTWLLGVPEGKKFIFTSAGEPEVYGGADTLGKAVVPLGHLDTHLRPENERSNAQRLQLLGLSEMFRMDQQADWYIIVGDDTYIDTEFMLKGLEKYDSDEHLWLAPMAYREVNGRSDGWKWILRTERHAELLKNLSSPNTFFGSDKEESQWSRRHVESNPNDPSSTTYQFEWTTGATAWVLSRPAAELYYKNLSFLLKSFDIDAICYCPDLLTGFFLSLLGLRITTFDHMRMHPYAVDSKEVDFSGVDEVTLYHYVAPGRMPGIHERALHSKVDRLVLAGEYGVLAKLAQDLFRQHQEVAARRLSQLQAHKAVGVVEFPRLEVVKAPENLLQSLGTRKDFVAKLRVFITEHFTRLRVWQSAVLTAVRQKHAHVPSYDIPLQGAK